MPFDVHLMIENPDQYIGDFVTEQTEYITVHQEACRHMQQDGAAYPFHGRQTGSGHQSWNAGFRSGIRAGRCRSDPDHVGQSGIWRTEVHSVSYQKGTGIKRAPGKIRT